MRRVKLVVPGGVVWTARGIHRCQFPDVAEFGIRRGDVFVCGTCDARYLLIRKPNDPGFGPSNMWSREGY